MRILIADDADFMRLVLRDILERLGHEVAGEADNGRDAVSLYFMLDPDVVTLDITMPFMSGIAAAERILERNPGARIVMISALGTKDHLARAASLGVRDFIIKPFDETRVRDVLNRIDRSPEHRSPSGAIPPSV